MINYKRIISLSIISAIIVFLSLDFGMFWDNVLFGSKVGNELFQNGIFNWGSISIANDAGHPPFLATLLAAGWKVFGKSLAVSHWIMYPFIFGALWQLYAFTSYFVKGKLQQALAFVLVVADPTLLSQVVLVGPEIIHVFLFFMALNAMLRNDLYLKVIGLALLGLVSYRGMMLCAGLFLIDMTIYTLINKRTFKSFFSKSTFFIYLISSIPSVIYIVWRLVVKGWVISQPLHQWGSALQFTSFTDFLINFARNLLILGFQFADFGRLVIILFILFTFYKKRKNIKWEKYNYLLAIAICSTIIVVVTSLIIKNTMGHRYYVVSYISIALLSFVLIKEYKNTIAIYVSLLLALIMGNFIVYSDSFAQGWDSSLAHLPYWNLRHKAINYMDGANLSIDKTATFFPNSTTIDNIDLNGDQRSFINFTGIEQYVFYSNVYNLTDKELQTLKQEYHVIKSFEQRNVRIEIMERTTVQNRIQPQ